ncbi:MAG: hypothetical protein JWR89_5236 [Tardiphaga sp.]|jgi:hypothetical protein|uniref:hypothetical protein n=1 Tax=Tardiphaga sp. TaxID=1926292 RepID=UPI0026250B53|nr:hypothetical protein [Tardiphaga sp.]MDB5505334.1 hypothetical protein [Tardiphaga sp.]
MKTSKERRSARRMKRSNTCAIVVIDGQSNEFRISDVSTKGVMLIIERYRAVPRFVEIALVPGTAPRMAKLIWRKAGIAGFEFLN